MDFIDLGLPSKTLWANCNIGADKEEDTGLYFLWGETNGYILEKTKDVEDNVFSKFDKYTEKDGLQELEKEDDAAFNFSDGYCKTPTMEQFQELLENTEYKFDENRKGFLFKSKINKNSIFLPFNGHSIGHHIVSLDINGDYMSSTLLEKYIKGNNMDSIITLCIAHVKEGEVCCIKPNPRHEFCCIRPVKTK